MHRNIDNALCYGCLSSGRNQLNISDYYMKQCFTQILLEIPISIPEEDVVTLCWQCHALLKKFTKFKEQVKNSYLLAQEYVLKNPELLNAKNNSNLKLVALESQNIVESVAVSEYDIKIEYNEPDIGEDTKTNLLEIVKQNGETFNEDDKELMEPYTQSDEESLLTVMENHRANVKNNKTNVKKKKKKGKTLKYFTTFKLSEAEMVAERAEIADSVALKESSHVCRPCLAVFSNEDRLARHLHDKHQRWSAVVCDVCGCGFEEEAAMLAHHARHYRRYRCAAPGCALIVRTKRAVHAHYTAAHASHAIPALSEESETTIYYSAPPLSQDAPSDHQQPAAPQYKSTEEFPCDKCEKSFKWKTSLRKHRELHRIQAGEAQGPYCRHCRISFTSKYSLSKHIKSFSHLFQLRVQKLKEAGGEAGDGVTGPERERQMREIKQNITQKLSKHRCPHCEKSFQWKGNLLRHIQSHVAKARGELECVACSKTFASVATYQQHVRTSRRHAPAQRFACDQCNARFVSKPRLRDHVLWEHLRLRNHICPHCQKAFKSNTSLYLHKQAVHRQDAREYLCDHCGRAFPGKAKLRSHIAALHSGTQLYRCAVCPAAFSWHSCLSRHTKLVHRNKAAANPAAAPAEAKPAPAPLT